MRLLFFLLTVLLSGSALDAVPTPIQILGPVQQVPPQCADPTYACQDLENARQCGVVKSCAHDIWATMSAPDDNDDICQLCKEMVKEARDQLLSNMTQEEIKEVFEGSCKLLRIKVIVDGCIKIFDDIIPELVEMLASRMDPNMVCTVSGLCNMAHLPIQEHLQRLAAVSVNSDRCDECITIVNETKILASGMSEADFDQLVTKLCEEKESEIICKTLVTVYGSEIYQFMISCDPKTVCTSADMCPSTKQGEIAPSFVKQSKNVGDDLVCQFCTNVLEHIKELILANTTVEEFRTALLNFCTHLGHFSDECKNLVNNYYDMIFDEIRKLDTKGVCTFIGLCQSGIKSNDITPLVKIFPAETLRKHTKGIRLIPASLVKTSTPLHPMVKLFPAKAMSKKDFKNEADVETNDIFGNPAKSQLPAERLALPLLVMNHDVDCAFCKAVTFFLEKDLGNDRSKDRVKTAISEVCDKWVTEFPKECRSFLEKYSDQAVNHMTENGDFDALCTQINACQLEEKDKKALVKPPKGNDLTCDLCKEVIQKVEDQIKDERTEEAIKHALDNVCKKLPESMAEKCQQYVETYIDVLITLLVQEITPDEVCAKLKLCPGIKKIKLPKSDINCDLCKQIVAFLEDELKDKRTEDAIKNALDKICHILPKSLSVRCENFINTYSELVITLLMEGMDPTMLCAALKVCPEKDLRCETCQDVLHYIQVQLADNDTQDELKNLMKRLCDILPWKSSADNCEAFVDEYGSSFLVIVAQELDPSVVCPKLGLCPSAKEHNRGVFRQANTKPLIADDCGLCMEVVGFIDQLLEDDDVDKEITMVIEKVCNIVPASVKDKCSTVIETYGPYILQMIGQVADSKQVCQDIDLCSRPPGHVHLLGGNKCTFGPSYWCQSKAHAAACEAEMFCHQKVWKN